MDDQSFEEAIKELLNDSCDVEDRILAARHLAASDDEVCFKALVKVCKTDEAEPPLLRAAGQALRKVAHRLEREDELDDMDLNEVAREDPLLDPDRDPD